MAVDEDVLERIGVVVVVLRESRVYLMLSVLGLFTHAGIIGEPWLGSISCTLYRVYAIPILLFVYDCRSPGTIQLSSTVLFTKLM